jgi:diguanylate cyclase (GGDEF)-like protein
VSSALRIHRRQKDAMAEKAANSRRPTRTSLYRDATWLAVGLRWALLAAGIFWLYPVYGLETIAAWILIGVAVYNLLLTALHWYKLHPSLWFVALFDLAAITVLLVLLGTPTSHAVYVYGFIILAVGLAYGWKGIAFALTGYLVAEFGVLLTSMAERPGAWSIVARVGSIAVGALVLGALVERHENLRMRLARATVELPTQGVFGLQEFTRALEYLHKLAARGRWPYSVMVIDIGKPGVETSYKGAGIEEELLKQLALEARSALRSTDIVGRVGADVFAIAMPDTPKEGAEHVATRLKQRLHARAAELEFFVGLAEVQPSRKNGYDECLHSAFAAVRESKLAATR